MDELNIVARADAANNQEGRGNAPQAPRVTHSFIRRREQVASSVEESESDAGLKPQHDIQPRGDD